MSNQKELQQKPNYILYDTSNVFCFHYISHLINLVYYYGTLRFTARVGKYARNHNKLNVKLHLQSLFMSFALLSLILIVNVASFEGCSRTHNCTSTQYIYVHIVSSAFCCKCTEREKTEGCLYKTNK